MKGKVTVKCTVLKASSKFASFFKGIIIPLARIAILYHKRAPYSSQKVRKKKRTGSSLLPKYIHVFPGKYFELL